MSRFQDLFRQLVSDLGGVKSAAIQMGCSQVSVRRLMTGARRVDIDQLAQWLQAVKPPADSTGWDREGITNVLFYYWLDIAPPDVATMWDGLSLTVHMDEISALKRLLDLGRQRIDQLEQERDEAKQSSDQRQHLLAERVAKALRRMHADKLTQVEAARAAAKTLAFTLEVHHGSCPDPAGLPSVAALHALLRSLGIEPAPVEPCPTIEDLLPEGEGVTAQE